MVNCLITRLQESVNDSSLVKFDSLRVRVIVPASGAYASAIIQNGKSVVINPVVAAEGIEQMTWSGNGTTKYYNVKAGWGEPGDVIEAVLYKKSDFIAPVNGGCLGVDIESLFSRRTSTTAINAQNTKSFGSIESLYRLVSMTGINVNGCPDVTGDIKNLAEAMVAAGRTSGNLSIYCNGGGVKCNGTVVSTKKIVFDSSVEGGYTLTNI